MLAAAVDLVLLKRLWVGGLQESVFQTNVALLGTLEADPDNLVGGLTQVLEGLYDSNGS